MLVIYLKSEGILGIQQPSPEPGIQLSFYPHEPRLRGVEKANMGGLVGGQPVYCSQNIFKPLKQKQKQKSTLSHQTSAKAGVHGLDQLLPDLLWAVLGPQIWIQLIIGPSLG